MVQTLTEGEQRVRQIFAGALAGPVVLIAHEIGLFSLLESGPKTISEIGRLFDFEQRPLEALLATVASCELVTVIDDLVQLTPTGKHFLTPDSPYSFAGYCDMLLNRRPLFGYDSLKDALFRNQPSYHKIFESTPDTDDEGWAWSFTNAMHSRGRASSQIWPELIDLSSNKVMLDIGGGSGVHSIACVKRWPGLKAIVLDRDPVCAPAQAQIRKAGLEEGIQTLPGDFWSQQGFPPADLHFYSEIFHNYSLEACFELARKSFEGLPPGGLILVHEMLLEEDKAGPLPVATASLNMLLWTEGGKQHTGEQIRDCLEEVGFSSIEIHRACGYFSLVVGVKPDAG